MSASLVIFDCDGVLVDSETVFSDVLVEDLAERGLELTPQSAMGLFAGGSMQTVMEAVTLRGVQLEDDWVESIYSTVLSKLEQGVDPVPGVLDLFEYLHQRSVPFCVASNGPIRKMQVTLGQNGFLPYLENALFSAYDIGAWKPEPNLFLHAAEQFNTSPEHCVVIEDSTNGTLAAQRAGMPCLAYAPVGSHIPLELNGARPFETMQEVPELLGIV